MYTIGGELYHHGILGMHWGIRRYQPYSQGYKAKNKGKYNKKNEGIIDEAKNNQKKKAALNAMDAVALTGAAIGTAAISAALIKHYASKGKVESAAVIMKLAKIGVKTMKSQAVKSLIKTGVAAAAAVTLTGMSISGKAVSTMKNKNKKKKSTNNFVSNEKKNKPIGTIEEGNRKEYKPIGTIEESYKKDNDNRQRRYKNRRY